MSEKERTKFTIVGAGLGGALMACYLGKAGHAVEMYEKRPDPRKGAADRGRSINLALSLRGIHALEEVGIAKEVLKNAIPMKGRMMHAPTGELTFQPYGTESWQVINSVSRAGLNMALLDSAQRYPDVRLHFGEQCTGLDWEAPSVELTNGSTQSSRCVPARIVIGSDGAFSAVRDNLQKLDRFDFRQDYLSHGYKELTIPPGPDGEFALEKNALHIWPRGGFMMIALPNADRSFTCTLFWPLEGPNSFGNLKTESDIRAFFVKNFADAVPLMPTLVEDYQTNPASSLVTIRCRPWYYQDKVVLLGDAAHAVVPFYGQGMNASFEDCTVLNECVRDHEPHWEKAFQAYEHRRKGNTDALANLAIQNFLEMRDHVASGMFLLKKKAARGLHRLFPRWYMPLYTMVTFSRMPYSDAVRRARRQNEVLFVLILGLVFALMNFLLFAVIRR